MLSAVDFKLDLTCNRALDKPYIMKKERIRTNPVIM